MESASEEHPTEVPRVTEILRLPEYPLPTRHRIALSDAHSVLSQDVSPVRIQLETTEPPKPAPLAVRLVDPVVAMFRDRQPLSGATHPRTDIDGASADSIALMLPPRSPAVSAIRRLAPQPKPATQSTDESAIHRDASQALAATAERGDDRNDPNPYPCSVIIDDPVLGRFEGRTTDSEGMLIENAELMLPMTEPALTNILRVLRIASDTRQRSDVSDSQPDTSQLDPPCRTCPVRSAVPSPSPCTMTLTDPLAGAFMRRRTLVLPTSVDKAAVRLPAIPPVVTCSRREPQKPDPGLPRKDESDCHSVASQPLAPSLLELVATNRPSPAPCTVRL